jgi:hypothetical protein
MPPLSQLLENTLIELNGAPAGMAIEAVGGDPFGQVVEEPLTTDLVHNGARKCEGD